MTNFSSLAVKFSSLSKLHVKIFLYAFGAALVVALLWPTIASLHTRWVQFDSPYSHAYLVVCIACYIFLQQARQSRLSIEFAGPYAAITLIVVSLLWVIGLSSTVNIAHQFIAPLVILSFLWLTMKSVRLSHIVVPVILVYSVIPIWDYLVPMLQSLTVYVCSTLLSWFDYAIHIHDVFISIPAGTFEVARGCSGLNYFLMSITVNALYASMRGYSGRGLMVILAVGLAFGLSSNWVRVLMLIWIGDHSNMQSELLNDHNNFGLMIFGAAMIANFYLLPGLLKGLGLEPTIKDGHGLDVAPASSNEIPKSLFAAYLLLILIVLLSVRPGYSRDLTILSIGENLPSSTLVLSTPLWDNYFRGNAQTESATLQLNSALNVQWAYYQRQESHSKLLSSFNKVYNDEWLLESRELVTTNAATKVWKLSLANKRSPRKLTLVYWYVVGDSVVHSTLLARLYSIYYFFLGKRDAVVFFVGYECSENSQQCQADYSQALSLADELNGAYVLL